MLNSGTKLGPYQIQSALGAGGMGEVYRATDSRLARDVALKVLPDVFARDSERMARFEREAKVLASLNHPNIAALYGLEESTSTRALVMEIVEGPTLAQRIAQGPIPVDDALPIARQIAEALEFAHERGIIHRDLKPANIKLTPDGQVKLLDFGLAKALEGETSEEEPQNSPTLTAATRAGVLLGTAAYMAPEQARGKRVDRRCDIWAFGCVLYEMLTGRHAFSGETISDILAGVIRAEPEWSAIPASIPPSVARLLRRCLQKDPRQRLRDIGEARIAIEQTGASTEESAPAPLPTAQRSNPLPWAVAAVSLVCALALGVLYWQSLRPAAEPVLRASLTLDEALYGVFSANPGSPIALSHDGSKLVFVGAVAGKSPQLYVRLFDQQVATPILGTDNATQPFFSPDGQWVGFFADGKMRKVPLRGGPSTILCDAPIPHGAAWASDDTIIFGPNLGSGLQRVSSAGGTPQNLTTPNPKANELSHRWPQMLPGGRSVLFTVQLTTQTSYDDASIAVLSLDTGKWTTLFSGGTYARYVDSGDIIYAHAGTLMAVPFDLAHFRVTGPSGPVQEGVITTAITAGGAEYDVSDSGLLAYIPGSARPPDLTLVWVDHKGVEKQLPAATTSYLFPRVSPDGKLLAIESLAGGSQDVWVYDFQRNTLMRLTFTSGIGFPLWMPDSRRLIYRTRVPNFSLRMKAADGSGNEQILLGSDFDDPSAAPHSVSPDGKLLLFSRHTPNGSTGLYTLALDGTGQIRPYLEAPYAQMHGQFSPDGRWVVYTSNESSRDEVYVQPFPGPGGKWMISIGGGSFPLWSHNGHEIFFRNEDKIMSVAVETQPTFKAGTPRMLFQAGGYLTGGNYDVAPDGQHFLMIKEKDAPISNKQVNIVAHWTNELRHRASTR